MGVAEYAAFEKKDAGNGQHKGHYDVEVNDGHAHNRENHPRKVPLFRALQPTFGF